MRVGSNQGNDNVGGFPNETFLPTALIWRVPQTHIESEFELYNSSFSIEA